MKSFVLYLGLSGIAWPLCAHATIFKCIDGAMIIYQDTPCAQGQTSELIVASIRTDAAAGEFESNAGNAKDSAPQTRPRLFNQPSGLALGMFDTQVLNLRGWGRPAKITRSKSNHAWHEEWTYFSPQDGQRQLLFANGKLTDIW